MKRSKTEIRNWNKLFLSIFFFIWFLFNVLAGALLNSILVLLLSYSGLILCCWGFFSSGYNLGWEYKKLSLEDEQ